MTALKSLPLKAARSFWPVVAWSATRQSSVVINDTTLRRGKKEFPFQIKGQKETRVKNPQLSEVAGKTCVTHPLSD